MAEKNIDQMKECRTQNLDLNYFDLSDDQVSIQIVAIVLVIKNIERTI